MWQDRSEITVSSLSTLSISLPLCGLHFIDCWHAAGQFVQVKFNLCRWLNNEQDHALTLLLDLSWWSWCNFLLLRCPSTSYYRNPHHIRQESSLFPALRFCLSVNELSELIHHWRCRYVSVAESFLVGWCRFVQSTIGHTWQFHNYKGGMTYLTHTFWLCLYLFLSLLAYFTHWQSTPWP